METLEEITQNAHYICRLMFGEELYQTVVNTPLRPIDYNGIDIKGRKAGEQFSIRHRLSQEYIDYCKDNNKSAFDLFIECLNAISYCNMSHSEREHYEAYELMCDYIRAQHKKNIT